MHKVPSCVKRKIVPMAENLRPPAFRRAAARTIRFSTFPYGCSSRKLKSLARQSEPGDILAAINQWQSGPCGPATLAPSRNATNTSLESEVAMSS
jgi:hypothetical protein